MDAILLAAGNSTRFGANKLLYEWKGKRMYRYVLELLYQQKQAGGLEHLVVVSQYEEIFEDIQENFPGIEVVCNPEPERGISSSLRLGLEQIRRISPQSEGCLFTVADQPFLSGETLEKILKEWKEGPKGIVAAASGDWIGNPVIFDAGYYPELLGLSGDVGGKKVVRRHPEDTGLCEIPETELRDIDTPDGIK